jgi:hypothetical protein
LLSVHPVHAVSKHDALVVLAIVFSKALI